MRATPQGRATDKATCPELGVCHRWLSTEAAPTTTRCTRNAASSASGTCPTPRPSPRWACTRCSTAARRPPASSASTARASTRIAAWAWSATISATRRVIERLPGRIAIGHNRYATTGDTILRNVQPLYADFEFGGFAVAHNGNLTNAHVLHRALVRRGCLFQSTTDSEVFVHLIAISLYSTVVDRLIDALKQVVGRLFAGRAVERGADGRARPAGRAPADPGPHRHTRAPAAGCWPARPARSTSSAPISSATSNRARSSSSTTRACTASSRSAAARERFCVFEYIYFARPGFGDGGHAGLRRAQAHRRRTGARSRRAGRCRRAGAGFRRAGGDGLFEAKRHPVRAWDHPQPLCRPHLHRADRPHPPSGREAEALGEQAGAGGQAGHPGG